MNKKKVIGSVGIVLALIVLTVISSTMIDLDYILSYVQKLDIYSKIIAMTVLVILQIVIAFLPGEPIELAAGYIFGPFVGTIICLVGSIIGTVVVYFSVKAFGNKLVNFFFSKEKIDETNKLIESRKGIKWLFILFLIPGTPKDIMTYVVSLSTIPIWKWLFITSVGRIPSIITSTFVTGFYRSGEIHLSIITLIFTILLVGIGFFLQQKRKEG